MFLYFIYLCFHCFFLCCIFLYWAAFWKIWSQYLWWRRRIWNIHPWLSSLQKKDCYVSKQSFTRKELYSQRFSEVFFFLCVCPVMQQKRWSTQQMRLLQSATCASPKCTRRAKAAWVKRFSSTTCSTKEINAAQCSVDFTSKTLGRFGVDHFKTAVRAKKKNTNARAKPCGVW